MNKKEIKNLLSSLDNIELPDKNKIINSCPVTDIHATETTDNYIITTRKRRLSKPLAALCSLLLITVISGIIFLGQPSNPVTEPDNTSTEASEIDSNINSLNDTIPSKELLLTYCLEKGEDYTADRLSDYNHIQLAEAWGEPDGGLSGLWGDIWQADSSYSIIVYYDSNGFVNHVKLHKLSTENPDTDVSDSSEISNNNSDMPKQPSFSYRFENMYNESEDGYIESNSYESHLIKQSYGEPIWDVVLDFAEIHGSHTYGDLVLFYGIDTKSKNTTPLIVLLNSEGELLWRKEFFNGYKGEYITHAKISSDEIIVLTRCDDNFTLLTSFDLLSNITGTGEYSFDTGIKNIYRIPDGYLLLMSSNNYSDEYFTLIDNNKVIKGDIYIPYEDVKYFFSDVTEYNGYLYLSANAVPLLADGENTAGGRYEIAGILNKIFDDYDFQIPDEDMTKLTREHFTATLIQYDLSTGETKVVNSIPESMAWEFKHPVIPDAMLAWGVGDIVNARFSPATSAYSMVIETTSKNIYFDSTTQLVYTEETGETVYYYK